MYDLDDIRSLHRRIMTENKCYITCMASAAPTVSRASNAQGTQDHIKFTAYFETACLPQLVIHANVNFNFYKALRVYSE